MATFGLSPKKKKLREAEFKCNKLGCLVKEISKQNSIQTVAWLLLQSVALD